jgi:hypothetical protein
LADFVEQMIAAIAPHVLKQKEAIAQSKHCDHPNPSSHRKNAIAPHVLKQN